MNQYVPSLTWYVRGAGTVSNWLSQQALAGRVIRREVPEHRRPRYEGRLGRPAKYEYNVASVAKLVKEITKRQHEVRRRFSIQVVTD
jgi:hypothetical protein